MLFKGKNALITGSSRGIGRGIALKLAEKGARIAIHYYRNHDAAQATLESIRKLGTSMISKSQEETEVSVRLEEWGLEAGVGRISWRTACDPG